MVHTLPENLANEAEDKFRLTDPVTSSTITAPASLRSDRDQHGLGTSDRDPFGITAHLYRNQQGKSGERESVYFAVLANYPNRRRILEKRASGEARKAAAWRLTP
ncbi:MAG: hypothetical protein DMG21_09260 [Acidobacteria bacterium]|nr:MAG: hypothetical protein DMG21_09260 [Acidobacteriota bacterium]